MSKKHKVTKKHYLFAGVVFAVVIGAGIYLNVPSLVFGGGPADRRAPIISNVEVKSLLPAANTYPFAWEMTVTWTTDKVSTSWICAQKNAPATKRRAGLNDFKNCGGMNDYVTSHSQGYYLDPSTTYYYVVKSTDYFQNTAQSEVYTITTPAAPALDTSAPTVSISAPANNSTVSGSVAITANATDNVGVTQVQFLRNGTSLGTDTTSPYSISWGTLGTPNGTYSLTAVAKDAAGNSATSLPIIIFVDNISTSTATTTP